jgi:hypothetical protein
MVTAREVANLFLSGEEEGDGPASAGVLRVVTVRMKPGRLAWIEAMARSADVSRNEMLNQVIAVGIGAVLAELPDVVRGEIHEDVISVMQSLEVSSSCSRSPCPTSRRTKARSGSRSPFPCVPGQQVARSTSPMKGVADESHGSPG